ncbi:MAG: tyrosine-type recombinase/integrase [Nocardioidaceae bacterium]|nr:tyrosine-type recombinase/integrase [Nocardioidaceae bacterium]
MTLRRDAATVTVLRGTIVNGRPRNVCRWAQGGSTADLCSVTSTVVGAPGEIHPVVRRSGASTRTPENSAADLRHGWATMALAAGVHPKVVQERLGHANIGITLDTYSHVTEALHDDAAERVADSSSRREVGTNGRAQSEGAP